MAQQLTALVALQRTWFSSYHLPEVSQASVTPALLDLTLSSNLFGYQEGMWCKYTHAGKTLT